MLEPCTSVNTKTTMPVGALCFAKGIATSESDMRSIACAVPFKFAGVCFCEVARMDMCGARGSSRLLCVAVRGSSRLLCVGARGSCEDFAGADADNADNAGMDACDVGAMRVAARASNASLIIVRNECRVHRCSGSWCQHSCIIFRSASGHELSIGGL